MKPPTPVVAKKEISPLERIHPTNPSPIPYRSSRAKGRGTFNTPIELTTDDAKRTSTMTTLGGMVFIFNQDNPNTYLSAGKEGPRLEIIPPPPLTSST